MNWRFNAYCPQGHIQTIQVELPDDPGPSSSVTFHVPGDCETCEGIKAFEAHKHEKRELRRFRRELKRLG